VDRLVTVGSQVGLFGELTSLKWAQAQSDGKLVTPASVKHWVNIYDPDDMLSFLADPVFDRVTDSAVRTGAPFPASHSEYWYVTETYTKMLAALPAR
jgi:hypothetical protein